MLTLNILSMAFEYISFAILYPSGINSENLFIQTLPFTSTTVSSFLFASAISTVANLIPIALAAFKAISFIPSKYSSFITIIGSAPLLKLCFHETSTTSFDCKILFKSKLLSKTLEYKVYDNYVVEPDDLKCTSQLTNGETDITLITCTMTGKQRTIIKARAVNVD